MSLILWTYSLISLSLSLSSNQYIFPPKFTKKYRFGRNNAESHCVNEHGTHLISIHSDEQFEEIQALIIQLGRQDESFWIGLRNTRNEENIGQYSWSDGTPFNYGTNLSGDIYPWQNYTNAPHTDDERFISISSSALGMRWDDTKAAMSFFWICAAPSNISNITTTSSTAALSTELTTKYTEESVTSTKSSIQVENTTVTDIGVNTTKSINNATNSFSTSTNHVEYTKKQLIAHQSSDSVNIFSSSTTANTAEIRNKYTNPENGIIQNVLNDEFFVIILCLIIIVICCMILICILYVLRLNNSKPKAVSKSNREQFDIVALKIENKSPIPEGNDIDIKIENIPNVESNDDMIDEYIQSMSWKEEIERETMTEGSIGEDSSNNDIDQHIEKDTFIIVADSYVHYKKTIGEDDDNQIGDDPIDDDQRELSISDQMIHIKHNTNDPQNIIRNYIQHNVVHIRTPSNSNDKSHLDDNSSHDNKNQYNLIKHTFIDGE